MSASTSISPPAAPPWEPELRLTSPGERLAPEVVFGRRARLLIEVGCGNGTFLAQEAAAHSEVNHLGIERSGEFFAKTRKRMLRHGLANVRLVQAEAGEFFAERLPAACATRIVINFSDPWPKRRHRRRRLFRPPFVEHVERALVPGGELIFRTDVGWYFNFAVGLLRRRAGWTFLRIGPEAPLADEAVTNYERKARQSGSRVWGFVAAWSVGSPAADEVRR